MGIHEAFASLAAVAVSAWTLVGCSSVPEPGSPVRDSSPLFDGYESYRTREELKRRLPESSTWQILTDSKGPSQQGCPRFDELTIAVPMNHLGQKGRLQLTFINDRLETTSFTPEDFSAYVKALQRTGIHFEANGQAAIAPATEVWQWDLEPRFVGWRDKRFAIQVKEWISSCS